MIPPMNLPFSEACERNRAPILSVLRDVITDKDQRLLEIGAGTGQHAVSLAPEFPRLVWHPTDRTPQLAVISQWIKHSRTVNVERPVRLDVATDDFPKLKFDVVFTANTLHIMSWKDCKSLFKLLGNRLREGARVVIYGPLKYGGEFTSPSNAAFDESLKASDPQSGIRAFEDVDRAMQKNGFELVRDYDLPAHNRALVYRRLKFVPHAK